MRHATRSFAVGLLLIAACAPAHLKTPAMADRAVSDNDPNGYGRPTAPGSRPPSPCSSSAWTSSSTPISRGSTSRDLLLQVLAVPFLPGFERLPRAGHDPGDEGDHRR